MAPLLSQKRKREDPSKSTSDIPSKKSRKQRQYHSPSPTPSDDEFSAVDLDSSNTNSIASSKHDSESDAASSSFSSSKKPPDATRRKRNDPSAFATSMMKILSSKLSTSKRADPVLARSATAALANAELSNSRLEIKARRKLREERKLALEKGRVKDVLLGTDANGSGAADERAGTVAEAVELERRLRKTAQRGVVKLFNAVRAAQVKGEEAARQGGAPGRRKERVGEMSRQGFLELVAGGGKGKKVVVEEA